MIILSKPRVKGCVSSWLLSEGVGGGGGEVKGKKSGENEIHRGRGAVFVRAG